MSGKLYVVATPIGNLEDLTPRARKTLAEVTLIAAEDTRHTGRLLMHIGCKTPLIALHDHNEEQVTEKLIARLINGESLALVSDAGTPLISDPGFRLVREAHRNDITVVPVVGASAVTAALSTAGIATDRFCFEGFLAAKSGARKAQLAALSSEPRTLVFYESVHRIRDSISDMIEAFGQQRTAFIGRELTKMHEQCVQGSLASIATMLDEQEVTSKGEFVIVVAGNSEAVQSAADVDRLLVLLADRLPTKEAAGIVAEVFGLRKNELYERLLALRE